MASTEKVFSPNVLMIDNETLSLRPDAHVVQVGYAVANIITRQYLVEPTSVFLRGRKPGHIDLGTVRFWMTQDDAARKSVFGNDRNRPYATPIELFDIFASIIADNGGDGVEVFASPAMFDLPQLTMMWQGRKPWRYGQERDMGTLYKRIDPLGRMRPPTSGTQHNAEDDVRWQMEYLFRLNDVFRMSSAGFEWSEAVGHPWGQRAPVATGEASGDGPGASA